MCIHILYTHRYMYIYLHMYAYMRMYHIQVAKLFSYYYYIVTIHRSFLPFELLLSEE